jgi:hypothetical protein
MDLSQASSNHTFIINSLNIHFNTILLFMSFSFKCNQIFLNESPPQHMLHITHVIFLDLVIIKNHISRIVWISSITYLPIHLLKHYQVGKHKCSPLKLSMLFSTHFCGILSSWPISCSHVSENSINVWLITFLPPRDVLIQKIRI